jgi:hypothetical protein
VGGCCGLGYFPAIIYRLGMHVNGPEGWGDDPCVRFGLVGKSCWMLSFGIETRRRLGFNVGFVFFTNCLSILRVVCSSVRAILVTSCGRV